MKYAFLIFAVLWPVSVALAAGDTLIRLDDPTLALALALGKQVNVRFSDGFVKDRLPKAEYDGLVVSEVPDGKICLFGRPQGIEPADPKLNDVGREEQGDICAPRADVSVRVARQEVSGAPAVPFYSTDTKSCAWAWTSGKGIALWTEDCSFDTGRWDVAYDAANDWFALRVNGGDPYPVLRQFRVEPGQTPEALLPELKAKGLVLDDAECVFAPAPQHAVPEGWTAWDVVPTGKRKQAFEASPTDEVPEPPCGELGLAVDFTGYFAVNRTRPDRVLYINLGQDGTMIDPFSVRFN